MMEINLSAGQRGKVVRRAFSSIPMEYRFSARAAAPGEPVRGIVEVRISQWIFPGTVQRQPLGASNTVSAGFWNTFVSVDVVAEAGVIVSTEGRHLGNVRAIVVLGCLIVAIAAVMILVSMA